MTGCRAFPMRQILDILSRSALLKAVLDSLRDGEIARVKSMAGSLRSVISGIVHQRTGEPVLMIFEEKGEADTAYSDLVTVFGSENVILYQEEHHTGATVRETLDAEVISLTEALKRLNDNPNRIIVTDVETVVEQVPQMTDIGGSVIDLRRGQRVVFEDFAKQLALGGFERSDLVDTVGEYAVRGGIIDIYPVGADNPLRIEFFGDEIDSIREFDPLSQRSVRDFDTISIMGRLFHSENEDLFTATLLDHLKDSTIIYLEEPERIFGLLEETGEHDMVEAMGEYSQIRHSQFFQASEGKIIDAGSRAQPSFSSSLAELCKGIDALYAQEYNVFLLADGDDARRRVGDLIDGECDRAIEEGAPYKFTASDIRYESETFSNGFVLPEQKLAVITEHEVFSRRRARVRKNERKKFKGFTLRELKQLRPGDFVVHIDKGIGKFLGLETIEVRGTRVEAVKLEYAGTDTLFVNLNYINRLQKYSSREGAHPKLSKLGTEEWERKKNRAKKRVKDIARELIKLYALRKSQPGIQYPEDTQWQRELEVSFLYEDTPDQAKATFEVKNDMETPSPMDRLVCGDVGFGKTEVAVRAAFKAVQAGKQVAVLTPTTILSQQHYNTFRDRLARYAVNIGLLSRFRSKAQQKETLEKLKKGLVDIIVGTHRILSKDVEFKDLGLLIIDEEQRFGVAAKEKLRQLRANVDTLTLTATPIPRTLNFSLMGARDLSLIETPPRNRLPIVTEMIRWDDEVLAEAVRNELKRGGQCFLVHWRIGDIEELAGKINDLVPEARVTIAHGEMTASEIEKTMMGFIEKEYDILVATKIIESGIDIPSVNTIMINRADKFGLAELYQLRGRVGRSNIQAYCYMVVPPPSNLTRNALKRLQAIQELSELGSGLKLAMRDLEIRGAGNLLGAEQSGFIDDVGFELYQKIVDEAVDELKRDEFQDVFRDQLEKEAQTIQLPVNEDIAVDIPGDALITKDYIRDDAERYEFYLKMYTAPNIRELEAIFSELRDRFGEIPQETLQLLTVLRLRLAAMETGGVRLTLREAGPVRLELPSERNQEYYDEWFQPIMFAISKSRDVELEAKGKGLSILFHNIAGTEDAERAFMRFRELMAEGAREVAPDEETV